MQRHFIILTPFGGGGLARLFPVVRPHAHERNDFASPSRLPTLVAWRCYLSDLPTQFLRFQRGRRWGSCRYHRETRLRRFSRRGCDLAFPILCITDEGISDTTFRTTRRWTQSSARWKISTVLLLVRTTWTFGSSSTRFTPTPPTRIRGSGKAAPAARTTGMTGMCGRIPGRTVRLQTIGCQSSMGRLGRGTPVGANITCTIFYPRN